MRRYDWLATPGTEVDAWVHDHNARSAEFLTSLPQLRQFQSELTDILSVETRSLPIVRGTRSFQLRRAADEQQPSLWVSDESGERCLVNAIELGDPNNSITEFAPSPDGSTVAWAMSTGGADWMIARFRDVETGVDADDLIDSIKWPQFAWLDNDAVAYMSWGRPPSGQELLAMNSDSAVRLHRLGTPHHSDEVLYRPGKAAWVLPTVSADAQSLLIQELDGTVPAKILRRAITLDTEWESVVDGTGPDELIDVFQTKTLVLSFATHAAGEIHAYSSGEPRSLVYRADETRPLARVLQGGHRLIMLSQTVDGSVVTVLDLVTNETTALPVAAHTVVHNIGVDDTGDLLFLDAEDIGGERSIRTLPLHEKPLHEKPLHEKTEPTAHAPSTSPLELDIRTVFAKSADGTAVPMRVIRAAGAEPEQSARVFLSVYGGYGVPYVSTGYEAWHRAWLAAGGVLAYAGVRGGSEYGETWHQAAVGHNKQVGIDDLIACVAWFDESGWAAPRSVVLNGMSNGGLMVGTVLTQRPDLLGAAVPEVAVVDMLNFHRYTAAHGWIREYGDPDVADDRGMLAAYSPLHNITDSADYPPTLVLTADKDDRVPPGPHSYKLAAALLDTPSGRDTTFLRVASDAGHGSGRSLLEKVTERSAVLAFAAHAVRMHESSPTARMEQTQ